MTAGPSGPPGPSVAVGWAFLSASRRHLVDEYPAKIDRALALLDEDDVWWRPDPATNSIGHLLRHLAGNVRQWVVHGIGGATDLRDRAAEFSGPPESFERVRVTFEAAVRDADAVLAGLTPDDLMAGRSIQGLETTVLDALYHVVEHFSMHTGQILWIAKSRTGRDLGFYQVDDEGRVVGTRW